MPGTERAVAVALAPIITKGTGLGLAITQNILRAHGGELEIESVIGRGTAVTLWIARDP